MKRIDHIGRIRFGSIVAALICLGGLPAIALPGSGVMSFRYNDSIQASAPLTAAARRGLGAKAITGSQVQTLLTLLACKSKLESVRRSLNYCHSTICA